ncbi:MAG: hypothetical protein A2033_05920 [Bacteroidetes bacterium GWA2_31_9]|nr:MAG: hypothetical protein A2033_05920 [Bacteroidetes bacterium GWA2_31_9]
MQNIKSSVELKNAILLLEIDRSIKEQLLKDQFHVIYESVRPINIIKNTIKDITSSPILSENLLGSMIGLATGFISKKIVVGSSGNIFKKLLGSVIQFGVTNVVSNHNDTIKIISQSIVKHFFRKKESANQ